MVRGEDYRKKAATLVSNVTYETTSLPPPRTNEGDCSLTAKPK